MEWDEVDRGALLVGEPGTGKTSLARALAQEAGVNFIAVSASSDWMTGDGLSECILKMVETFGRARQLAPTILFVDEIDSMGNREQFTGHNASWNTSFLDGLLTEMDGLRSRQGVVVIGATNDETRVDPALRRAGRLDRLIRLPRPNLQSLKQLYKLALGLDHGLSDDDIEACASQSLGLTGADVERLARGARRRARLDGNRALQRDDLIDEIMGIPADAARQPIARSDQRGTAIHEAGHAVVALCCRNLRDRITGASIVPGDDGALGWVATRPSDKNATRASLLEQICMALAGRAAEALILGKEQVSTGAGGSDDSDLAKARRLAEALLGRYGFSTEHPDWYVPRRNDHSDAALTAEAQALIQQQRQGAQELLKEHRTKLEELARQLMEKHVMRGDELRQLLPAPWI